MFTLDRWKSPLTFSDLTDGVSNTFLVGEDLWAPEYSDSTVPGSGTEWGSFHGFKSKHPVGVEFVYADGSVHFVKDTIPLSTYRGLASFAGGERLIDAP